MASSPIFERKLKAIEERQKHRAVKEAVTSRMQDRRHRLRAGPAFPSTRCWRAKRAKLLKMEQALEARVVGQSEAVRVILECGAPRGGRRLQDPNRRPSVLSLFLGRPAWQNRTHQSAGSLPV